MRLILASASPRRRELLAQLGLSFQIQSPSVDETLLPGEGPDAAVLRLSRLKAEAIASRLRSAPPPPPISSSESLGTASSKLPLSSSESLDAASPQLSISSSESLDAASPQAPASLSDLSAPGWSPLTSLAAARAVRPQLGLPDSFQDILVLAADTLVACDGQILGKPADPAEMERHIRLLSGRPHQVWTGLHLIDVARAKAVSGAERTEVEFDRLSEAEIRWYVDSGEGMDKAGSYGYQGLASVLVRSIQGCYFNVVGLPLSRLRGLMAELGHDLLAQAGSEART